jgi:hypothetical protein
MKIEVFFYTNIFLYLLNVMIGDIVICVESGDIYLKLKNLSKKYW